MIPPRPDTHEDDKAVKYAGNELVVHEKAFGEVVKSLEAGGIAAFPPLDQAFPTPLTLPPLGATAVTPAELYPAAGHCTFVVGQILRVAPGATVTPYQVLTPTGECTDTQLADTLAQIGDDTH